MAKANNVNDKPEKIPVTPNDLPNELVGHRCSKCNTKVWLPAGEKFTCCKTPAATKAKAAE